VTKQHVQRVPAVIADRDTLARVKQAVDELDTDEATQYAIEQGIDPPTDEADWELLQRFEADGPECSLVWVLVTETQDTDQSA
jgi:hypothetical protein